MDNKKITGREETPHIGIFGRCNAGKSTFLNFITRSDSAIVAPEAGTTTDVVRKSYEITDFGPVIFLDTAGPDDTSGLGDKRRARTMEAMRQIDLAVIVFREWEDTENRILSDLRNNSVPVIAVRNNFGGHEIHEIPGSGPDFRIVRLREGNPAIRGITATDGIREGDNSRDSILEAIKAAIPEQARRPSGMFGSRVGPGDTVLLVCPIDSEAPAGRLILPQVKAIRELLDLDAMPVVVQPRRLDNFIRSGLRPRLVVTDSQVFPEVKKAIPEEWELTSFSILLASAKGDHELYLKGLDQVDRLEDGARVLVAENCLHQTSCDDIGKVKIPRWLEEYTGKTFDYTFVGGLSPLPEDLGSYALMIQCGGCMVTASQLRNRIRQASAAGVPVTNYGMLIRKVRG